MVFVTGYSMNIFILLSLLWTLFCCSHTLRDFSLREWYESTTLFQVRDLVPESQAYMDLLAFERKLDATIMRKRLDIQVGFSWLALCMLRYWFPVVS